MPDIKITENGTILNEWNTGMEYLVDVVKNNLLNTYYSSLYEPDFGTELKQLIQTNIDDKEFEMKFALIILNVEKRIKEEQELFPSDLTETLEKIVIKSLVKKKDKRWEAVLKIVSSVNESDFNLNLKLS